MSITPLLQDQNPWWGGKAVPVPAARRDLHAVLLERIASEDRRATVVIGPRQVGKTTLLKQVAADLVAQGWPPRRVIFFDFSDDRCPTDLPLREVTEAVIAEDPQPRVFLLDEVEYAAPGWERFLKQAVDRGGDRFIVTTSAAAHLRDAGRESGAGRWDELRVEGLTYREYLRILAPEESPERTHLAPPLPLPRFLTNGGFPEHVMADPSVARQRLRADVGDKAILRDLMRSGVDVLRVQRLFVYVAQRSGAIVDTAKLAVALGADARSVRDWLGRLRETQLVAPLRRYTGSAAASLRDREKVYVVDHGLAAAFALEPGGTDTLALIYEAAVFRHLRSLDAACAYYRDRDGLEADFVVTAGGRSAVVEVTAASSPPGRKLGWAREVRRAVGADRAVVVCTAPAPTREEEVDVVPIGDFLLHPEGVLS